MAAGALGAAVFTPLGGTGIGWLLAGLCVLGGWGLALRTADLPPAERRRRGLWAGAALALLGVLAFRNAWWLVTFCVLGAFGCTALAVIGGRSLRAVAVSVCAAPVASLRALPWLAAALRPGADGPAGSRAVALRRSLVAAVGTLAVLVVFGGLLASADAVYRGILAGLLPDITAGTVFRTLFLLAAGGLVAAGAAFALAGRPDLGGLTGPGRPRFSRWEWAAPAGTLVLLFAGFVAVQATALFGGARHLARSAGLTVAEYARGGFWQLVAVSVLTLAVLLVISRWAQREDRWDRLLLRWLLGPLCVLSLVIVASALSRMYTYQRVFSFTGERLFVMAFEAVLGLVFVLVLVAGLRGSGAWIPETVAGLLVVMLLALAALNPEGYAARRNVERYRTDGVVDLWYLRALSADATPVLATLPPELRRCALSRTPDRLRGDRWYGWNLGRQRARAALRAVPGLADEPRACRHAARYDGPVRRP
ncbi:DUF4153 domain-containing protein [Pilimelia terevasa]|uniref:DUF4153 domain-containing protein n=1 Tax=Pilimelia terevasa TaxID=53372 RepID=UPI0016655460|nr:DUF4173 domain-containing protein [Pilimelia terevasa]